MSLNANLENQSSQTISGEPCANLTTTEIQTFNYEYCFASVNEKYETCHVFVHDISYFSFCGIAFNEKCCYNSL